MCYVISFTGVNQLFERRKSVYFDTTYVLGICNKNTNSSVGKIFLLLTFRACVVGCYDKILQIDKSFPPHS